jgi:hypothetical protein
MSDEFTHTDGEYHCTSDDCDWWVPAGMEYLAADHTCPLDRSTPDRVMFDIETLGIEPGSAILSIGAVRFDPDGLGDTFEAQISLESCEGVGLEIEAGTLAFWLDELTADGEINPAHLETLTTGDDVKGVLREFREWVGDADEIWANSPKFDCGHLEAAYDAVGWDAPWSYDQLRDVRTVRSLPVDVEIEQTGEEHDALDDACYQAEEVRAILAATAEGATVPQQERSDE